MPICMCDSEKGLFLHLSFCRRIDADMGRMSISDDNSANANEEDNDDEFGFSEKPPEHADQQPPRAAPNEQSIEASGRQDTDSRDPLGAVDALSPET